MPGLQNSQTSSGNKILTRHTRPLLLSCGILRQEIEKLVNEKQLDVDVVFLDAGLHAVYSELEKAVINALEKHSKDAKKGIVVLTACLEVIKKFWRQIQNTAIFICLQGGCRRI
jgi:hypothetical protein